MAYCRYNKKFYSDYAKIIICDINPSYLVHTSVLADKYIQVPLIKADGYYRDMLSVMKNNGVDILVPLIDDDIRLFPKDNLDLKKIKVMSVAPSCITIDSLSNKKIYLIH